MTQDLFSLLPKVNPEDATAEDLELAQFLVQELSGSSWDHVLDTLESVYLMDYDEKPVPPEEFLNSHRYLGSFVESLYPKWKEELEYVLNPANGVNEWILHGSIGTGKTSAACVAQLYKLYWLVCMKNPQKLFGLAAHMPVYFAFFSTSKTKAEDAINAKFEALLNMSPYFRERLPKNMSKVFLQGGATLFGSGYKEHPKKDDLYSLSLPHNLHLLFGSQTGHALSLDVFSATLDEMNFRSKKTVAEDEDENSAQNLYHQVRTRIESRFDTAVYNPGLVINISSARASDSFVESRIKEARDYDLKNVRVSAFALWDVKPGRYSHKTFRVFVGSGFRSSKILEPGETIDDLQKDQGECIVEVPANFYDSFRINLDASIRDLAGIPTASLNKLFKRKEVIKDAVDVNRPNPISPEIIRVGVHDTLYISDFFDADEVSTFDNIERKLKYYPRIGRFIHVDLAKNSDKAGISCLCLPYYYQKKLDDLDDSNNPITLNLPYVFVDFCVGLGAPEMDEISFEKVKHFLLWLRDSMRYPITRVTYDSWQSVHSIQLLTANGFETETLSVDKTDEPYMELLNAYTEGRISVTPHNKLMEELRNLEHDIRSAKGAVDHPRGKSKDVADSVAGAYANALAWVRKYGFASVGTELVQRKALEQMLVKSPKQLKDEKTSKELGFDEVVSFDVGYDGRFRGIR